ncbi:MAG TPA: hypothetical protein VFB31_16520 [Pseudolabrys sp.]|jgi:hypothetical protein|nr:hypothetical protein [Pseudolabrys sp.]
MNQTHVAFFERAEAKPIEETLRRPELIPQYELMSRLEMPAVQAVVWELESLLEDFDPGTRDYAIQSSGALIGDILTSRGFRIARGKRGEKKRGRVRKARFIKSGTIWEPPSASGTDHRARFDAIVEDIMVRYRTTLEELAK